MTTICPCCGEEGICLSPGVMLIVQCPAKPAREIFIEVKMRGIVRDPGNILNRPSEGFLCMICWEKLYARLKEALPEEDPAFPKETP